MNDVFGPATPGPAPLGSATPGPLTPALSPTFMPQVQTPEARRLARAPLIGSGAPHRLLSGFGLSGMARMGVLLGVLSLSLAGCVSQSQHQKVQRDLVAADQQGKIFFQELETCKASQAGHQQEVASCSAELEKARQALKRTEATAAELNTGMTEARRALNVYQTKLAQQVSKQQQATDLSLRLKPLSDARLLEVLTVRGRTVVRIPEAPLFELSKADVKADGRKLLEEVAKALNAVPHRNFQVEAHTDNVPLKKSPKYMSNWELSSARALEVAKVLVALGLPPERVSAAGFGEFSPAFPNDTAEHQTQNRRIEISFVPTQEELSLTEE